jgi:excisionase family DNA binding protein
MTSNPNIAYAAATGHSVGTRWRENPFQTIARTSEIRGCSRSQIYAHLKEGELTAVRLGGKTLVTTESLDALLATARPWSPDHARIKAANRARLQSTMDKRGLTKSKTGATT